MLEELKKAVYEANMLLPKYGLVTLLYSPLQDNLRTPFDAVSTYKEKNVKAVDTSRMGH